MTVAQSDQLVLYDYWRSSPSAHVLHAKGLGLARLDKAFYVEVHYPRYGYAAIVAIGFVLNSHVLDTEEIGRKGHPSFDGPSELARENLA